MSNSDPEIKIIYSKILRHVLDTFCFIPNQVIQFIISNCEKNNSFEVKTIYENYGCIQINSHDFFIQD